MDFGEAAPESEDQAPLAASAKPLARLTDNRSYTVQANDARLEVFNSLNGLVAAVDFRTSRLHTAQRDYRLSVGRRNLAWQVKVFADAAGNPLAFGSPTTLGYNTYLLALASGAKFRMTLTGKRGGWQVRRGRDQLFTLKYSGGGSISTPNQRASHRAISRVGRLLGANRHAVRRRARVSERMSDATSRPRPTAHRALTHK